VLFDHTIPEEAAAEGFCHDPQGILSKTLLEICWQTSELQCMQDSTNNFPVVEAF